MEAALSDNAVDVAKEVATDRLHDECFGDDEGHRDEPMSAEAWHLDQADYLLGHSVADSDEMRKAIAELWYQDRLIHDLGFSDKTQMGLYRHAAVVGLQVLANIKASGITPEYLGGMEL